MAFRLTTCDIGQCRALHGVTASRRGPAAPYTGPIVSPLRPASREGQDALPRPGLREAPVRLIRRQRTASPGLAGGGIHKALSRG